MNWANGIILASLLLAAAFTLIGLTERAGARFECWLIRRARRKRVKMLKALRR